MSLCYSPQECECAFCDPNGRDAQWRDGMIKADPAKPVSIELKEVICNCETCGSGVAVSMDEWLKTPAHQQLHERIKAAIACGEIHVQGGQNEQVHI